MPDQINIFLENKPGRLKTVTRLMADHNINLRALVVQDRGDFGMLKIFADDPDRAFQALVAANFACARRPVLAVAVEDQPGGLSRLVDALHTAGLNVLDAYGFVMHPHRTAVCCVETENCEKARAAAVTAGFHVLDDGEIRDL